MLKIQHICIVMTNDDTEHRNFNHATKSTQPTTTNNGRAACLMSKIVDKEIDTSACAVEEREGRG